MSPESIIELSQLLQAMEAIRKGDQVSILPVSDESDSRLTVGKRTVKRGAFDKKFPAIENKENKEKQPVEVITRKSITANARPELRDFKKQQQKARKIAREGEFLQMQSASSSSSSNRSSDNRGMPVAELLLKAPNSSDVIRAILDPEGMTIITKDKDKNKDKNRDIDFTFNALGGDESLPLPSSSFPSLHTVEDSTPRTVETLSPPVIGKMSSPPSTFQPDAASTLQQDTSSSSSNSSSSSGARLQWQAVHHCLSTGDTVAAFSLVLERGELEDLAHIMKLVGPRPHVSTGA